MNRTETPLCGGLLQRRMRLALTRRGWLCLLLLVVAGGMLLLHGIHPFLAVNDPRPGGALVVEGWMPDYALAAAMTEFRRHPYHRMYVTGAPIERGASLSAYRTHAELGAAILVRMGMNSNTVEAVPTPLVEKDRTYASAVEVKRRLLAQGGVPAGINLITMDVHARRSRLLYARAFGRGTEIGVTAIPNQEYVANNWWLCSPGVRTVLSELIAYGYARFCFFPADN